MTLKDVSNGPGWIIWIVFAAFAVISIILLSGHGANMIAGYNSASKEEKNILPCQILFTGNRKDR